MVYPGLLKSGKVSGDGEHDRSGSKFCEEAGFMRVVEVGQYFVTRDAGEFQQTVA